MSIYEASITNPKKQLEFYKDLSEQLQRENKKIKKQLETYEIEGHKQEEELDKMSFDIRKYKIQQKEFIEYLTSYIDLLSNKPDLIEEAEIDILEEILSKYKSIIGGKNEIK